jgi:hypothetical protein
MVGNVHEGHEHRCAVEHGCVERKGHAVANVKGNAEWVSLFGLLRMPDEDLCNVVPW